MPWICEDGRAHLRAYLVVRELTIGDVGERAERFAGANESRKSGQSSALVSKPLSLIKEVFERDLHRLPQLEDQLCRAYSTCCGTPTHCTSILQSTLLDLTTANTRYFPHPLSCQLHRRRFARLQFPEGNQRNGTVWFKEE